MDAINACQTIEDIQLLVSAEIWRDRRDIELALQARAEILAVEQGLTRIEFGHPEFGLWMYEGMEEGEDTWLTHPEFQQQGGNMADLQVDNRSFEDHCNVTQEFEQHIRRFNLRGRAFNVNFRNLHRANDLSDLMDTLFGTLLERTEVQPGELVGFEIKHNDLDHPILIPFQKKDDHTVAHITRSIERVLQSNQELNLDDGLSCQVTRVSPPSGNGKRALVNSDEFMEKHRSLIDIPGEDNICLPRAIVTALAYVNNDPQLRSIRKGITDRHTLQGRRAREIMTQIGCGDYTGAWGMEHVQLLQDTLTPHYQIRIFSQPNCDHVIFKGPDAPNVLYLYLHEDHYSVITKINAFLNATYYCATCNKVYSNIEDHRSCPVTCSRCFAGGTCQETAMVKCDKCSRWFANAKCLQNHYEKTPVKSVCEKLRRCKVCNTEYKARLKHKCNSGYCPFCKRDVPRMEEHKCFMSTYENKDKTAKSYIFFDFETQQVKKVGENKYGSIFQHEPICCIAHKVCDDCWKERNMEVHCANCKQRKYIFLGDDLLDNFVKWLFSRENANTVAMAHNCKGFDGMFILESLHRNAVKAPEMIFKGLEIMKLELGGVRVLDSLNFLPMPLSAIPNAFQLKELKKGYFPHLFSSKEAWNYVGPHPDAWFYGPAFMKQSAKEKFFQWFLENKDKEFNFQQDLINYCNSDVDILKMGVMTFRDTILKHTGLDPYVHAITISDACSKIFRMRYLPEKTIGLIPNGEYRIKDKFSIIGIKWLKWVSYSENITIRHALNGGEVKIPVNGHTFKADGVHDKTVYEFNGCTFHGCLKCFNPNTLLPLNGKYAKEAFQATLDRKRCLEKAGFQVVEMWECDFRKLCRLNSDMADFIRDIDIQEPMKARDAYYGGRTNCMKLYHHVSEDERIEYIDICSLYPYVLKYGIFPIGHPEIITEHFKDLKSRPYEGLVKCRVLPPKGLYHPVLPVRVRGKLMFPLCLTCAQERISGECSHSNSDRAFWGTWVTLELYKALELGYEVIEVAEVWDYGKNTMQYNHGSDEDTGLFTKYINFFLKMKQEASDWPKACKSEEDMEQYIQDYFHQEGIQLDRNNIKKNSALRSLAKLCLNSTYGKFGQRNNMPVAKCIEEPSEFFELVNDPTIHIKLIQAFNDKIMQLNYTKEDGFEEALPTTNVVIAAYVTTQARLKLYSYLERLQKSVLYFDTDSIMYVHRPGWLKVETGSYLGDMTNELEDYGEGAYIDEFVSAGPKNYAFRVQCPDGQSKHVVKIRGFTLDSITGKRLNMKTLKSKVFAYAKTGFCDKTSVVTLKITRTREGHVFTTPKCKTYSLIIDKRWCTPDFMSYPFGYQ